MGIEHIFAYDFTFRCSALLAQEFHLRNTNFITISETDLGRMFCSFNLLNHF
nr:MAG TPA: hypothetical protein [Caudoviricetes sp.]